MKIKSTKLISKYLILLSFLLSATSCINSRGWTYRSNSYSDNSFQNSKLTKKTVAVLPFADQRLIDNDNSVLLYLIPLMPFGYQDLNTPETLPGHINSGLWTNYNPKEDFAKAIAEELNNANIFKEVTFSYSAKDYDYNIKGEILATNYKGKIFSYGLSVYGPLLWYIGFPATSVSNFLETKLSIVNSKTKEVIFTKTYKSEEYKKLGWIYKLPNDFQYPEMLRIIYKDFINDFMKSEIYTK